MYAVVMLQLMAMDQRVDLCNPYILKPIALQPCYTYIIIIINTLDNIVAKPNFMHIHYNIIIIVLLNQACTGLLPAHAWFLEIALVHTLVCMSVRVSAPKGINNQWCDMM